MVKKFIQIINLNNLHTLNTLNGKKASKINPLEELNDENAKKEDFFYKYYDEYVKGYILIPVMLSGYYKIFGYEYIDVNFEKAFWDKFTEKDKKEEEKKEKSKKKV